MSPVRSPRLSLRAVQRRWSARACLGPIDLDVPGGEVVVVRGPNGSGKSTLLAAIAGVIPVTGVVCWDRRPVIGWAPAPARLSPDRTPRGLLALLGPANGDPMGIAPVLDVPMGRLSRGERRRVVLAASLVDGPDVLIWDEPLDSLDEEGRRRAVEAVRHHREAGGSAFVATHAPEVWSALADRVVALDAGRVVS